MNLRLKHEAFVTCEKTNERSGNVMLNKMYKDQGNIAV